VFLSDVVLFSSLLLLAWQWGEDPGRDLNFSYIGPGAGIALLGSFLAVLAALASAFVALVSWPVRLVWRNVRGQKAYANAKVKRVVLVGLDGLEPTLVEQYLAEGLLPNVEKLRQRGTYTRLGTTNPPLSPVAWSSFSTGANPGKHNIFDFLLENRVDYKPAISSVRIERPQRTLKLGKFSIPLSRPRITALRKSKPFWNVLGESGIFSSVLRVPITFPPDKFHGVQLSAMCVPDLLGTQGTFSHYIESGETGATGDGDVGGRRFHVSRNGRGVEGELVGPANPLQIDSSELRARFKVVAEKNGTATVSVDKQKIPLPVGKHSDWVRVSFTAMPGVKIRGVCRFVLKRLEPPFEMYCTPIQIDPANPVMPVSHPRIFSIYLSKLLGTYATLGLAEDTWSLSESVISEDLFLEQAYAIHDERERMLLDSLKRVRRGTVVCVFDAPDRIQHMFWRFIDENHPALKNRPNTHPDSIRDMYVRMDETVGRVLEQVDEETALFVLSDHGFKPFRRGVDLNAWLLKHGYLFLNNDAQTSSGRYLADIDWSRTKAFAIGLAGIYINQQGRQAQGLVAKGDETKSLSKEICEKLTGLRDDSCGDVAVHEAVSRETAYSGPYVDAAPDVIVGYQVGYRISWDAAIGKCGKEVFTDNTKAWSGDHCIHPQLVPGVLFSNLKLNADEANIVDLAPTTLELLGVETPAYMDGRSLLCEESLESASA
jgi:predicted AlkP superfamily phosphohydrolase/phosphomutase